MRWSIIRLIWFRELRDQLRDRRTVFMVAVLPVLLYPVVGFGVLQLVQGFLNQGTRIGVVGAEHLVPWRSEVNPTSALVWLAVTPPLPGAPLSGPCSLAAASACSASDPRKDYPPLLLPGPNEKNPFLFNPAYLDGNRSSRPLILRPLGPLTTGPVSDSQADCKEFLAHEPISRCRSELDQRQVDLLLVIPPDFQCTLRAGGRPMLFIVTRERDDTSRLVNARVSEILARWKRDLREVRLLRRGLPPDFDETFRVHDPERAKPVGAQEEEGLANLLVRIFPFVLVMWSLAGALYPAVDLCAGEKERGTMETLLISPAGREEIVLGKFLTIWIFSAGTALLNLASMGVTTWFSSILPGTAFHPSMALWAVLLLLPMSAFFSAICLAVGAYARSSKEGQYYLMPLFLLTMPLIFLTLAPGIELNPFYSMVPVTGVALLLQKLMTAGVADRSLGLYFIPVLAPMVVYSWLALRWAIAQFQREEVLFREAERLDLGLWLRRLFREKETLPSVGEALFCFGVILGLRWLSFNVGTHLSLLARTGISQLAFVATPPLFMAVVLTTRPRQGLALRLPPWWAWPVAVVLAVLVVPPLADLTLYIINQFPRLRQHIQLHHPLPAELQSLNGPGEAALCFLVLAILPALCEEIAFRGFILTGLLQNFRPRTAILLSSFLFSLYQMNVFQFIPHFVFGVVLGLLVVRSGSVLPAMLFHLMYNSLVLGLALFPQVIASPGPEVAGLLESGTGRAVLSVGCAVLAGLVLFGVWRRGRTR